MKTKKKPDLVKLSRLWQKRLKLTHWTLAVRYHRAHECPDDAGRCSFVQRTLQARISIVDPIDWPDDVFLQDVEQVLVHELLHLWFCAVQPEESNREMICFEQEIDTVAAALVAAARLERSQQKKEEKKP